MSDTNFKEAVKLLRKEKAKWKRLMYPRDSVTLLCDPLCSPNGLDIFDDPILAINDCRNELGALRNGTDRARENVFFVPIERDFSPYMLVVSKRDIRRDEEITIYYGDRYCNVKHNSADVDGFKEYIKDLCSLHGRHDRHS